MAEGFGLDVEFHAPGPAQRHCLAATRNANYYELALVHPDADNPIPPVYAGDYSDYIDTIDDDGTVPVPDDPGLGVDYDWEFIEDNATGSTRVRVSMTYRAGIIGAGGIAGMGVLGFHDDDAIGKEKIDSSHAGGYNNTEEIELVAVADIDEDKLETFGEAWEIPPEQRVRRPRVDAGRRGPRRRLRRHALLSPPRPRGRHGRFSGLAGRDLV